ncbi:dihydroneopterin aldolase [Marinibacterium profundimaris]|uniref:dihydroneopterin aldolase n=1 Tax=Marinibacterium profundimaris TaxID=1679460 RepID=A0A225NGE4_9RHOB|nr:dihydroneopterin aldolase [Marinibacterium profundimaris]OWU72619.1 diguanylate cyclase [Marinibacterium profundimaris]
MSSDIHLAFASLAERAAASATDGPADRISVRDHVVEVEIGAFQAERGATQRVRFNVVVEVEPVTVAVDDDVDRILSYDRITEAIDESLAEERLNLLETLAERVAERVLAAPRAARVFVRIEKLDRGPGALGVEIVRDRSWHPGEARAEGRPQPRLVYLSDAAIAAPHLPHWIDTLQAQGRPVIFCVGAGAGPVPQTGHRMTQRRIDLLAIEQSAWRLAARDDRCVVVSTRTELDWAMRHGQICVWAPSKIVLDTVNGPPVAAGDTVALAVWFAELVEAEDLLVVAADLPEGEDAGVRLHAMSAEERDIP